MKIKLLLCTVFIFFAIKIIAQSTDEEAVKKAVRLETESALKRDTTTWMALYMQDEKISRTFIANGTYYKTVGWKSFAPQVLQYFREHPTPSKYTKIKDDNYIIRGDDNIASVEYDLELSAPGIDSLKPFASHEYKTLMKVNNQWKITSSITIDTLSYTSGDSVYIEDNLNATGYRLLNAKKIKDAIEVFKVNVKLFPHSWNVYDSLGEAYADDGNTADAIKNYEMSVKINPKNDSGKQALEKLKKKK